MSTTAARRRGGEIAVLTVPKDGCAAAENEDACWPPESTAAHGPVLRLALADGVADSYRPGPWAREIVRAFGTRGPLRATTDAAEFTEVLRRLCAAWAPRLRGQVREEGADRRMEWWEKRKLRSGSAATVLAVQVRGNGVWTAAALGDSCVFQVDRDCRPVLAFPLDDPRDFDAAPATVASADADWDALHRRVRLHRGTWASGDRFFLASDALAAWVLRRHQHHPGAWRELDEAVDAGTADSAEFSRWVGDRRRAGAMRDDDVSVIRLIPA
ncbi:protein phosphatase 2C domain-containing protein [Actinomadura bangladeshensis]|uniref:PPM-type phosphatase domain-containing protein n=1 Tax=Actinomadura bangladeshensis TaxID=453573 RepID=A0A4R4NL30_9ACTN|nr:protein phosphatase 2C domain-containing protein [Actinomadura bangladeshensis]TDC09885.1 hypothetical protein E1284_28865 [Actinomadura bangladeshensis]